MPLLPQYECRLCLTLHTNEGNYLAHTQGGYDAVVCACLFSSAPKAPTAHAVPLLLAVPTLPRTRRHGCCPAGKRHQQNLAKRAAREAAEKPVAPAPQRRVAIKKTVRIGRPGYRVTKQFDAETGTRGLLFQVRAHMHIPGAALPYLWHPSTTPCVSHRAWRPQGCMQHRNWQLGSAMPCCLPAQAHAPLPHILQIEYPEIEEGTKPRHRVMSSYEQRKEPWSKEWQYLLFAAEPYVSLHALLTEAAPQLQLADSEAIMHLERGSACLPAACFLSHPSSWACCHLCSAATFLSVPQTLPRCLYHAAFLQEVIAFKIPSYEVEKHPEKLFTHW